MSEFYEAVRQMPRAQKLAWMKSKFEDDKKACEAAARLWEVRVDRMILNQEEDENTSD